MLVDEAVTGDFKSDAEREVGRRQKARTKSSYESFRSPPDVPRWRIPAPGAMSVLDGMLSVRSIHTAAKRAAVPDRATTREDIEVAHESKAEGRRIAEGLLSGAILTTVLVFATGQTWAVPAIMCMISAAAVAYMPTTKGQPYAYWIAYAASAAIALLGAGAWPDSRPVLVPLAAVELVIAGALFTRWRTHRPH